jgi:hypothetical protein
MKHYRIIVGRNFSELVFKASEALREGWTPLGAPFFTPNNDVAQAFTK